MNCLWLPNDTTTANTTTNTTSHTPTTKARFFHLISCVLPIELEKHIKGYIPLCIKVFLCKKYYNKYHCIVRTRIFINSYENYIRSIIRRDNEFVFEHVFQENTQKWLAMRKYNYKNMVYINYIYFLLGYCIENNSDRCKNVIQTYLDESGLSKNQHKKNIVKNTRWTN